MSGELLLSIIQLIFREMRIIKSQKINLNFRSCSLFTIYFSLFILLFSCSEKKVETEPIKYTGPVMTVDNLVVSYSDSGRVSVKLTTAKQLRMQNDDEIYPKPVYVTFYDKKGVEYSSLRGDSGRFYKTEGLYKVMGNVFFFNRLQQQSLATEELDWSPATKKIYTHKAFKIKTPLEEFRGIGMESDQDFTHYKMSKVTGVFLVDSMAVE